MVEARFRQTAASGVHRIALQDKRMIDVLNRGVGAIQVLEPSWR
jgi:hypothetical protein